MRLSVLFKWQRKKGLCSVFCAGLRARVEVEKSDRRGWGQSTHPHQPQPFYHYKLGLFFSRIILMESYSMYFLCLASFIEHNVFGIHPCYVYQCIYLFLLMDSIPFVPQFVYPFTWCISFLLLSKKLPQT